MTSDELLQHDHEVLGRKIGGIVAKLMPETIQRNVLGAAFMLMAHELLKERIVGSVRGFLAVELTDGEDPQGSEYQTEVLDRVPRRMSSKGKFEESKEAHELRACLAWLMAESALTSEDCGLVDDMRLHRNEIGHELVKIMIDPDFEVRSDLMDAAQRIMSKLDRFWGPIVADTNGMVLDMILGAHEGDESAAANVFTGGTQLLAYVRSLAEGCAAVSGEPSDAPPTAVAHTAQDAQ